VASVAWAVPRASSPADQPRTLSQDRARLPGAQVSSAYADLELSPWEANQAGELTLRLTVDPYSGIHIYAPGQRGYSPLSLTFPPEAGIKAGRLELPQAEPYVFEPTGERFLIYRRRFTAIQHATLVPDGAAARSGSIPLTLRFQACDELVCFKPETISLVWTRKDTGAGRPRRNR